MSARVDPAGLRHAGLLLGSVARGLEETGLACRAQALPAHAWHGSAALVQSARVESLEVQLRSAAGALDGLVSALRVHADACERELTELDRLRRRREVAHGEREALRRTFPDPGDTVGELLRQRRLAEVEDLLGSLEGAVEGTLARLDALARQLEQRLRDLLPPDLLADLRGLVESGQALFTGYRGGRLTVTGLLVVTLATQHARTVDLAARALLQTRLAGLVTVVQKAPLWARMIGRIGPWGLVLAVWQSAVPDLLDGGGHDGVRGAVTRGTALAALVGSVAMTVPHPLTVGLGAIGVGSYLTWSAGTRLWDHRELIGRVVTTQLESLRERAEGLVELLRWTPPGVPWSPFGPLGPGFVPVPSLAGLPKGARRLGEGQRVEDDDWLQALEEVPWVGDVWRIWTRQVGQPAPVDDIPLGPWVRLPTVPGLPGLPVELPRLPWWRSDLPPPRQPVLPGPVPLLPGPLPRQPHPVLPVEPVT